MAIVALTVFSTDADPVTVGMERKTWEELTVEFAAILYGLPELVIVDAMRNWLKNDGTASFSMELICVCGGTCGLVKVLEYQP